MDTARMSGAQRELLLALAYIYTACGQPRRALALLAPVERAAPDDPALLRLLSHAHAEAGQGGRALDAAERLARVEAPGAAGPRLLRSRALHALGRAEEARACFDAFARARAGGAPL